MHRRGDSRSAASRSSRHFGTEVVETIFQIDAGLSQIRRRVGGIQRLNQNGEEPEYAAVIPGIVGLDALFAEPQQTLRDEFTVLTFKDRRRE